LPTSFQDKLPQPELPWDGEVARQTRMNSFGEEQGTFFPIATSLRRFVRTISPSLLIEDSMAQGASGDRKTTYLLKRLI
jgi:hypothetical protein